MPTYCHIDSTDVIENDYTKTFKITSNSYSEIQCKHKVWAKNHNSIM
jgi:hypothetical protein